MHGAIGSCSFTLELSFTINIKNKIRKTIKQTITITPSGNGAIDDPLTCVLFCSGSDNSSLLSGSDSSIESDDEPDAESESSSSILKSESSDSDSIVSGNSSTVGVGLTLLLLGSRATEKHQTLLVDEKIYAHFSTYTWSCT